MSVLTQFTHGASQSAAQPASVSGGGGSTAAASSTITVPSDSTNYTTSVSNTTINATVGNQILFIGGSNDTITASGGNYTITASGGNNTIAADGGNNVLTYSGANNQINAGSGSNTLFDNSSDSTIVLPPAGQGTDTINGDVFTNGDTLDLRPLLAGTQWNGDTSTLGNFLNTSLNGNEPRRRVQRALTLQISSAPGRSTSAPC
jgi:Ca2+-binding RTX toxin-like protein